MMRLEPVFLICKLIVVRKGLLSNTGQFRKKIIGRTCLAIQRPCRKLGISKMMTQLFLKPGVLGPLPIDVGKILAMVRTAVRLALQEDELPVAQLLLSNMISCDKPFHQLRNAA